MSRLVWRGGGWSLWQDRAWLLPWYLYGHGRSLSFRRAAEVTPVLAELLADAAAHDADRHLPHRPRQRVQPRASDRRAGA